MLISDSHRFIFVHVRKAAGTSIREMLEPYGNPTSGSWWLKVASRCGLVRNYRRHVYRGHAPLRTAEALMPADLFLGYCKFAFVRNPWERLVSEYRYILRHERHPRHHLVSGFTFREFCHFQSERPDAHQWRAVSLADGTLGLDRIGRYESLREDFRAICNDLGLRDVWVLPHLNPGSTRDWLSEYDEATWQFVAQAWARDIRTFGYQEQDFEPGRTSIRRRR